MKRIIVLGLAGVVMFVNMASGSQITGTPLETDPDVDRRIRSAPLPAGYRFGRALPPSIDLKVEWQSIGAGCIDRIHRQRIFIGDKDMYRFIQGIFIERDGTIRVVDIHPRAMRGMRVWRSDDEGKNWRVEKETANATRESISQMLGRAKMEVVFSHGGTRPFAIWPVEAATLIKTEFRGLYEHRAPRCSAHRVFLAKEPNDPRVMAFVASAGTGLPTGQPQNFVRLFITVNAGEKWLEINSPDKSAMVGGKCVRVGGLAIKKANKEIRVLVGQSGGGPRMVQAATLSLPEIQAALAQ